MLMELTVGRGLQPIVCFKSPRRGEVRVGAQSLAGRTASLGMAWQHGLSERCQCHFGSAAMQEITARNLLRNAIEHSPGKLDSRAAPA